MSYLGKNEEEYLHKRIETDFANANIGTKESIDSIWIQFKTSICSAIGELVYSDTNGQSQTLSWHYEAGELSISDSETELSLHTEPCGIMKIIRGYMYPEGSFMSQLLDSAHNLLEDDDSTI